ncbi:MAG: glycosyltransferase family 87 protein [Acidobacteriota bacterium]
MDDTTDLQTDRLEWLWRALLGAGVLALVLTTFKSDRHVHPLYDFEIFWRAGRRLLAGKSPYRVDGFVSPLPLAVLFAPLALLPRLSAWFVYVLATVGLLLKAAQRRARWAGWALLSFPVLFTFFVGQVDLPLALSAALLGPLSFPLLLAKPQVAFVAVPWFLGHPDRRRLALGIAAALGMLLLCFWLRPGWIGEWRAAEPTIADYSEHDSNLYRFVPAGARTAFVWILSPVVLVLGAWLRERRDSWALLHLFDPVTNIYSAAVLAEWIGPLEAVLSWAAFLAVGSYVHHGAPMFVVALAILARRWYARPTVPVPEPEAPQEVRDHRVTRIRQSARRSIRALKLGEISVSPWTIGQSLSLRRRPASKQTGAPSGPRANGMQPAGSIGSRNRASSRPASVAPGGLGSSRSGPRSTAVSQV